MQTINYHNPVLRDESVNGLNINPDGIYVDTTFGGGGHSRAILEKLGNKGKLIAFDQDKDAINNIPDDKRLLLLTQNFRYLKNNLLYHDIKKVDGILADLGVSSHQFDEKERGFSFRHDSALDMRMNNKSKRTAADVLNQYPEEKLISIFREYGEIPNAYKLVRQIVSERNKIKFKDTCQFTEAISGFVPKKTEHQYLAKVFQALRIEVNAELQVLKQLLLQSTEMLKPKGRLVIISYHSLEDRLVKNFIKTGNFDGNVEKDLYGNFHTPFKQINKKVIVPNDEEISLNNRARSAKLRIAEKL